MMPSPEEIGKRLKELRLRRGCQQSAIARKAGVDAGSLSRMERGIMQTSRPKPDTIDRLLDALEVTDGERQAVFHVEEPPLGDEMVAAQVREFQAWAEETPGLFILLDKRGYYRAANKTLRAAFGLSDDEYTRLLGGHSLLPFMDASLPLYTRFLDEDRASLFAKRAYSFKTLHEIEQFDGWYMALVARIRTFPWAAEIWDNISQLEGPTFVMRQVGRYVCPDGTVLNFNNQANLLMKNPRFHVVELMPADASTRRFVRQLPVGS